MQTNCKYFPGRYLQFILVFDSLKHFNFQYVSLWVLDDIRNSFTRFPSGLLNGNIILSQMIFHINWSKFKILMIWQKLLFSCDSSAAFTKIWQTNHKSIFIQISTFQLFLYHQIWLKRCPLKDRFRFYMRTNSNQIKYFNFSKLKAILKFFHQINDTDMWV